MNKPVYKQQAARLADEVTDIESLLQKLEQKYPNRLPRQLIDEATLGKLIGRQEVIDYIRGIIHQIHNA